MGGEHTLCTVCQHVNNEVHLFHHMTLFSVVYIQVCCHAVVDVTRLYILITCKHVASGLIFPVIIKKN